MASVEKYDIIGNNYNQTRKADPFLVDQFYNFLDPDQNGEYLDIGCGTGNYTKALSKKGIKMTGIDPSWEMLHVAKENFKSITFREGKAEQTHLKNSSMDGIIGMLTIHHWPNLSSAFSELGRVLKPNGKIVLFTSSPNQMKGYWLYHYFPKMLEQSIQQMPSVEQVKDAMDGAKLKIIKTEKYFIQKGLKDHFLYCGKQAPELYLNSQILNGISSFSDLANQSEVVSGLCNLKKDIVSGAINDIMRSYENSKGDYMFLVSVPI